MHLRYNGCMTGPYFNCGPSSTHLRNQKAWTSQLHGFYVVFTNNIVVRYKRMPHNDLIQTQTCTHPYPGAARGIGTRGSGAEVRCRGKAQRGGTTAPDGLPRHWSSSCTVVVRDTAAQLPDSIFPRQPTPCRYIITAAGPAANSLEAAVVAGARWAGTTRSLACGTAAWRRIPWWAAFMYGCCWRAPTQVRRSPERLPCTTVLMLSRVCV